MQVKDSNIPEIKLSHRQRLFADEFLVNGGNAKKAAEKAGYPPGRAAEVAGSRLLKSKKVIAYIDQRTKPLFDKYEITQDRVMRTYAVLAWFDVRNFYREDGSLKHVNELDEDTALALNGMEVDEVKVTKKGETTTITQTAKVKFADRKAALDSICRIKGWNNPEGDEGLVINVTIKKGGKDAGNKP